MSKITVIPNPKTFEILRYDELRFGNYYRCVQCPDDYYINKIGQALCLKTNNGVCYFLVWSDIYGTLSNLNRGYQMFRFVEIDVEIKEV